MVDHSKINLVSSELAHIWKFYMYETLNRCVLEYFLATVEDTDIKALVRNKLETAEKRIEKLTDFFNKEGIPTPVGFGNQDVNLNAPKLFNDIFIGEYIYFTSITGLEIYGLALSTSARSDVREFFYKTVLYFADIQNKIVNTLLEKGQLIRSPYIPYPSQVNFVEEQSFLTGWLGERRPLHVMQITHLFLHISRNSLGKELLTGFSQTAKSEEIREYMLRGKEISSKLLEIFNSILKEDGITPPAFSGLSVTESTEAPFSDKLMLNLITTMISYGLSVYGLSLSESTRRDLVTHYTRIIAEIATYGEDGFNLLIKNGFMEEPPKAPDRDELAEN